MEDTGITYNDLKQTTNEEIAEVAYLLQTPKGRNRKERHCDAYYQEMATNREAVYVKVADRIANTQYSLDQGSSMFTKYQQEYPHFQTFLRLAWPELEPMWQHLDHLYSYKPYPTPV
ncbi:hypothetical protein Q5H92_14555 [Hymenobacter sp. M29]|uniref:Uncharacterized protein n=1 Tax=Hymenobacter mellowenesis TaxID=3063995 RepID=A0ABT9ACK2_9BACT|nr:hypothetical protein [Hymenobacter sp. M29]MDO7847588.1 hypothetical protein [Hymenobacter sp. M29]